jgi:hypothetical protein
MTLCHLAKIYAPSLNGPQDVATHLGHLGLILRAPTSARYGVRPRVSRPVWARYGL